MIKFFIFFFHIHCKASAKNRMSGFSSSWRNLFLFPSFDIWKYIRSSRLSLLSLGGYFVYPKKKNIHRVIVFDIFQIAFSFQQQQQEDERLRDQENLPKGSTVASSMNSVGNTSASTTDRIGKRHAFLKNS